MKKQIIFFDADGTLWYPEATKYTKHPVWVYRTHKDPKKAREQFAVAPTVEQTLKEIKKRNIITVLLSTNPLPVDQAYKIQKQALKHHSLEKYFDIIEPAQDYEASKQEHIEAVLKRLKIPKTKALMVGDSYRWDYKPATNAGIQALLIENTYENKHKNEKRIKRKIRKFKELIQHI